MFLRRQLGIRCIRWKLRVTATLALVALWLATWGNVYAIVRTSSQSSGWVYEWKRAVVSSGHGGIVLDLLRNDRETMNPAHSPAVPEHRLSGVWNPTADCVPPMWMSPSATWIFRHGAAGDARNATSWITLMVPHWLIIASFWIVPAVARRKHLRHAFIASRNAGTNCCPQCGYDWRFSTDRCSECGNPKALIASSPARAA